MFFHHKKLMIQVTGMHCTNCLDRIKKALEEVPDVVKVKGDLSKQEVSVFYDNALDQEHIKEIIDNLGYSVTGMKNID
ncbi:MAG: heavy metal-associated domain-containing protein [Bacilli bacterium]|nr:heavy metal-associated domain-containing protein [Bacilli bacterium]